MNSLNGTHDLYQLDLISGVRSQPTETLDYWLCDPSTGTELVRQAGTSNKDVQSALEAANEIHSQETWAKSSIDDRCQVLESIADNLDSLAPLIARAESIGSGTVISVTTLFAESLGDAFRDAARRLRSAHMSQDLTMDGRRIELLRLPWGPVSIIVPWNASTGVAAKKVAYALAVGAPVLLKANEWSPFACNIFADAIARSSLPDGAFQLVHGGASTGAALVSDRRIGAVSFTGSAATGRRVAQLACQNFAAMQLELSGNNPGILLRDADLLQSSMALAQGIVKLNGQWCEGPGKIFVPEEDHDEFLSLLIEQLSRFRIGSSLDPESQLGPLSHAKHRDHLDRQMVSLRKMGGTEHLAGELPEAKGWFWNPRVISGLDHRDCVEEIFGPAVTLHPYSDEASAVRAANESPYGLAAFVFGRDIERAMEVGRSVRFGEVKINGTSILDLGPNSAQSFWRSSGIGGHGDAEVFSFFSGTQIVGVDRDDVPI